MSEDTQAPEIEEIFDANTYQEAALATCVADDDIDLKRVHYGVMRKALRDFVNVASLLDYIKKSTMYGRPFPSQLNVGAQPCLAPSADVDKQVVHAILGIATEAGELIQALEAALFGGAEIDDVNLLEESGDIDWYQALLDVALGGTQEDRWSTNIAKLRRRYTKDDGEVGFTAENANNRDTTAEREILEEGHGSEKSEEPDPSGDSSDESSEEQDEVPAESGSDDEPVVIDPETEDEDEES
jgi:hypothetical protein